LRDHETLDLRRVVRDALDQAAPLELRQQLVLGHNSSIRARASRPAGSSAYSASYNRAWNVPGPSAPAAASSAATPNAASASAAASSGSPGRCAAETTRSAAAEHRHA